MTSKPAVSLLYDSGAFSAFTTGKTIDIDKYATFARDNIQYFTGIANLDVIAPTDVEYGAKKSFENFLYLKERYDLNPIPVFHSQENISWLDKMIEQTDYIGLSSSMGSMKDSIDWYNVVWDHVTDNKGFPVARFHAFGDATPDGLQNYPWFSADSTTWWVGGGIGGRTFINGTNVQFLVRTRKYQRSTCSESDTGLKREALEAYLTSIGLKPDVVLNKTDAKPSDTMMLRTYINAAHVLNEHKTRGSASFLGRSILFDKKYKDGGTEMVDPIKMHFVFTDPTAPRSLTVLAQLQVQRLLLSYFYTKKERWEKMIIPYLYDPIQTCKDNPKLRRQAEILSEYLINPILL